MILQENYTLSNGVAIPKLGLGTWFIKNKDVVQAVKMLQRSVTGISIQRRHTRMKAALERESRRVV